MACECVEKTLAATVERAEEQHKGWTIIDADYLNKGYNFSGKGNPINLYNEIKIEYTFEKVDGTTSKPKSERVTIYGGYCSFCGKKFVEG